MPPRCMTMATLTAVRKPRTRWRMLGMTVFTMPWTVSGIGSALSGSWPWELTRRER